MCHLFRDAVFIACIRDFLCNTLKQGKLANWCGIQICSSDWMQMSNFLEVQGHLVLLLVWLLREKIPDKEV